MFKKLLCIIFLFVFVYCTQGISYSLELLKDDIDVSDFDSSELNKKIYKPEIITDDFIVTETQTRKFRKHRYKKILIPDEKVVVSDEEKIFKKPKYTGTVKTEEGLEVVIRPLRKVKTKNSHIVIKDRDTKEKCKVALPEIGERVAFKVVKDVIQDGKIIISKGSIVYAKVGEVSPRAMGGAPAEMTLEQFVVKNDSGDDIKLSGDISTSGYSLSVWIGLAELATTPFIYGLAVPLLRLFPGGQAIISPQKEYIVYF